jgi:Mrp family chromosome partitioning ATPase/DUF971 family protein
MTQPMQKNPLKNKAAGLAQVDRLLAVSSCKGGVGKSTVAVNLAATLARAGARVGLFDADVYGPSLPTLVRPRQTDLFSRNDLILPLEYEGMKLMSFGFVPSGGGAAMLRGPMVTQIINQLLTGTEWGQLDVLIIDMPPGTGDVQLTLTQLIPLTAAVIVTTPQELSFVDVVKGIQMFHKLKVPTVSVIENMAYFQCPGCNEKHYLFGQGVRQRLVDQFGIRNAFELPLLPELSRLSDAGTPLAFQNPDHPLAETFREIAGATMTEIEHLRETADRMPTTRFVIGRGVVVTWPDGREQDLDPADLRRRCRCATCVEEMTGQPLLDPASVAEDIYPEEITPMGNYAVAIQWSDGHSSSIYPYEMIAEIG